MAESKRTFQSAKMDKDIDDRILPAGTYRDALNVSVDFSEDANVGALENLKGNELLANQNILGLSAASNPNAEVIGSIAHPEENKIYYFVTGDNTDGIFEYDFSSPTPTVNTVIVDSLTEVPEVTTVFKFEDAFVTASISQSGVISVASRSGVANVITQTQAPNNTGSAISVTIQVRVRVPAGYSNYNNYVQGPVTVLQPSVTAPSPTTTFSSNVATTTATLNGKINRNNVGVTTVGFNWGYNTAGTALTASELQTVGPAGGTTVLTVSQNHGTVDFKSDVTLLPSPKLISFIAFATNSVGTEYGDVKTFNTAAVIAPAINRPPNNHLFIVPGISSADGPPTQTPNAESGVDARQVGYGDWEKADGNYYFTTFATSDTGVYSNNPASSGATLTSTGVTIYDSGGFGTTTDHNYVLGSSLSSGQYIFTAALAGQTSHEVQIVTSSNATRTAIFSLNFASTGTGTTPFLGTGNSGHYQYNVSPNTPAAFKIGPYESTFTTPGVIIVPISTDNSGAFAAFSGFDATKLDVSITGKTEGTDYNYYICDTGPAIFGACPAVIISANPATINNDVTSVTHTLNITYNY
jgi:hypothetical protein